MSSLPLQATDRPLLSYWSRPLLSRNFPKSLDRDRPYTERHTNKTIELLSGHRWLHSPHVGQQLTLAAACNLPSHDHNKNMSISTLQKPKITRIGHDNRKRNVSSTRVSKKYWSDLPLKYSWPPQPYAVISACSYFGNLTQTLCYNFVAIVVLEVTLI